MKKYKYTINGNQYDVQIDGIENNIARVSVNGEVYKVEMEPETEPEKKVEIKTGASAVHTPPPAAEESPSVAGADTKNAVKAPLPGVITQVCVSVGQTVKAEDTVIVLEAMKMANDLAAEKDGKVKAILVKEGQSVMEGDPLVVIGD